MEKLSELSGEEPGCWLDWRPALAFAFAASMECLLGRGCGSWTGSLIKGSVCRRLRSQPFSLADLVGVTSVVMEADELFSSSMALSPSVARLSVWSAAFFCCWCWCCSSSREAQSWISKVNNAGGTRTRRRQLSFTPSLRERFFPPCLLTRTGAVSGREDRCVQRANGRGGWLVDGDYG